MQIQSSHGVLPDYLSCTYHPDHYPHPDVKALLLDCDFRPEQNRNGDGAEIHRPPDNLGLCRVANRKRFTGIQFSGAALHHIIRIGAAGNLLQVLCTEHHRVTCFDFAQDVNWGTPESV